MVHSTPLEVRVHQLLQLPIVRREEALEGGCRLPRAETKGERRGERLGGGERGIAEGGREKRASSQHNSFCLAAGEIVDKHILLIVSLPLTVPWASLSEESE